MKVSNMMTNKEVVSIQKLLMTYPLSAKNTSTENQNQKHFVAYMYQNRKSQIGGSKVVVVSFFLS